MPGLNRQGPPFGDGNQSGRRMGKCNPENKKQSIENFEEERLKSGRNLGRGRGRKFANDSNIQAEQFGHGMGRGRCRNDQGLGYGRGRNAPMNQD